MYETNTVRIQSYSSPYFLSFGLNTRIYEVSLRIRSKCGEIRTRINPNTDNFYAVKVKKPSKIGQDQKTLISALAQSLTTIALKFHISKGDWALGSASNQI